LVPNWVRNHVNHRATHDFDGRELRACIKEKKVSRSSTNTRTSSWDVGSAEVQIALLTERIAQLNNPTATN